MPNGAHGLGPESGAELVEWIVVTMILTLAFLALLQLVGDDLAGWIAALRAWVGQIFAH